MSVYFPSISLPRPVELEDAYAMVIKSEATESKTKKSDIEDMYGSDQALFKAWELQCIKDATSQLQKIKECGPERVLRPLLCSLGKERNKVAVQMRSMGS